MSFGKPTLISTLIHHVSTPKFHSQFTAHVLILRLHCTATYECPKFHGNPFPASFSRSFCRITTLLRSISNFHRLLNLFSSSFSLFRGNSILYFNFLLFIKFNSIVSMKLFHRNQLTELKSIDKFPVTALCKSP